MKILHSILATSWRLGLACCLISLTISLETARASQAVRITVNHRTINLEIDNPQDNPILWQYAYNTPVANCQSGLIADFLDIEPISPSRASLDTPTDSDSLTYCFKITDQETGLVVTEVWVIH